MDVSKAKALLAKARESTAQHSLTADKVGAKQLWLNCVHNVHAAGESQAAVYRYYRYSEYSRVWIWAVPADSRAHAIIAAASLNARRALCDYFR